MAKEPENPQSQPQASAAASDNIAVKTVKFVAKKGLGPVLSTLADPAVDAVLSKVGGRSVSPSNWDRMRDGGLNLVGGGVLALALIPALPVGAGALALFGVATAGAGLCASLKFGQRVAAAMDARSTATTTSSSAAASAAAPAPEVAANAHSAASTIAPQIQTPDLRQSLQVDTSAHASSPSQGIAGSPKAPASPKVSSPKPTSPKNSVPSR